MYCLCLPAQIPHLRHCYENRLPRPTRRAREGGNPSPPVWNPSLTGCATMTPKQSVTPAGPIRWGIQEARLFGVEATNPPSDRWMPAFAA